MPYIVRKKENLLRRMAILALVGALVLALTAGVAVAKSGNSGPGSGNSGKGKVTYNFEGTITTISTTDPQSVSVNVTGGNKAGRTAAAGQEQPMTFPVSSDTKIEINEVKKTLADLKVGDEVQVQSKAPKGATSFPARKIELEDEQEDD